MEEDQHEAPLDRRGGYCRARVLRTCRGAAGQSFGRKRDGMPGPNPGGPGLTPYSSGPARPMAAPAPAAPAPAAAMPPPSMSDTTSAMPPKHRHARSSSHGKMASQHPSRSPNLQGNVANQLNQTELARLQSGDFTPPPPPPGPDMSGQPAGGPPGSSAGRMPAGGRTTSDRYGR